MKIENKTGYTLITSDENSFQQFFISFQKEIKNFKNQHLILEISENINIDKRKISLLLDYAIEKKENGRSFVVMAQNLCVDDFPETFNIVPTMQEAEDLLEMEAIERELGF